MCEHHHAAESILCSQCDLCCVTAPMSMNQQHVPGEPGTTLTVAWDAPLQRPPPMR